MRLRFLFTLTALACGTRTAPTPEPVCATPLFGRPVLQSGLTASECGPACGCGDGSFTPTEWTEERLSRLSGWRLLDAPPDLSSDPYAQTPPPVAVEGVCGVVVVDAAARTYRLQTFASDAEATAAGAKVTHADGCGACSTLADLAVYGREVDLGRKVQDCGVKAFSGSFESNVSCLEGLGFTPACARIWAYNTRFTRSKCLATCLTLLEAPYHQLDGGLNACLECDERESGPVFKAVAGRTRRNTGIPSAICRPCAEVRAIQHDW
ncbi:MAG: hypothetical protein SFW67_33650 [Myxococcaceae bacterium]|nr:hypothetical protein [Myxococcaceae bacterium]